MAVELELINEQLQGAESAQFVHDLGVMRRSFSWSEQSAVLFVMVDDSSRRRDWLNVSPICAFMSGLPAVNAKVASSIFT
ncbi:hypothetical protein IVB16_32260 [Bradyrhizobium sp. 183]|uniref:hypothetical protein n=1 Tax=unclassified Bradyrhizobium TaxID=2631580 RepID=UPI001FFF4954|nr:MULTISPECIES: hypothetical protein [unclassified Bradyrhizobium]UPJ79364.1 hypothetical protein IVB17_32260 [Bradyrhizobium sp. 184]UPJ87158.1 hypothetical protein IVB16_32260 [Bradyrhizobium sp. 183]